MYKTGLSVPTDNANIKSACLIYRKQNNVHGELVKAFGQGRALCDLKASAKDDLLLYRQLKKRRVGVSAFSCACVCKWRGSDGRKRFAKHGGNLIRHVKSGRFIITSIRVVELDDHLHTAVDNDWNGKCDLDAISHGVRGTWKGDWIVKQW